MAEFITKLSFLSVFGVHIHGRLVVYISLLAGLLLAGDAFSQNVPGSVPGFSSGIQKDTSLVFENYEERGIPYIRNYTPEVYNAGPDNWAVVQSKEGIMYFGNKNGVLEYDGVSWQLIQLPNQGVVRSLAIDHHNKIYVGGTNEIGFLAPDSIGQMQFVSLKDKLDPAIRNFQHVWSTHVKGNEVYFRASEYLLRWDGIQFKVWMPNTRFRFSNIIQDTLYTEEENVGLRKLSADTLQTILPQSELKDVLLYGLAPYGKDQFLALSYRNGLFLINGNSLSQFSSPVNAYLKEQLAYRLEPLPNGYYSIGTLYGGVVIIDSSGEVVQILNEAHNISDNAIYSQYVDRQNGLWLATSNGISRVELLSPYTIFDDRLGIDGFVNMIHRHEGTLYVANNQGILYLEEDIEGKNASRFTHIGETYQGQYLLSTNEGLFGAANSGLYQIIGNQIVNTFGYSSGSLLRSKADSNRIFIGLLGEGLSSLKRVDGRWVDDGKINGVKDDIRKIVEDKDGNLWLESQIDGVWYVQFSDRNNENKFRNPSVKHFRANTELPEGLLFLNTIKGEPVFEINDRIYRYHADLDSIMVDPSVGELFGLTGEIAPKEEDEYGNIWMYAQLESNERQKPRVVAIPGKEGTYRIKKIDDERISHNVRKALYPDDNGIIWYGGSDGIVRHNTNITSSTDQQFQALIRRITVNGDSLIFGGAMGVNPEISLPYGSNNLRFEFATPSFDDESANQFQFYLDGFDEKWPDWTSETQKDYTNIPEGTYTFRVRAKNIYGTESSEATLEFTVLPPWYRSWWAYIIYALIFLGFVMAIVRWRSYKLQKEKEALQKIVSERTEQVKRQAEQLRELDEAKSRFFANISHEFRTPLTLILGQVQQLESGKVSNDPKPMYEMIKRNGKRVLSLVNQLLNLATLESGKMQLRAVKTDLISFLKPIIAAYESLAESKGIQFDFEPGEENLPVYIDRDKIENVVQNVISNAFKFTPDGGRITVSVNQNHPEGSAQIRVQDSGPGIAPDQLDKIFDRFYQSNDTHTKYGEGSGIGLALAKELVTLHKGTISAESKTGKGSCFTISLPLGREHLQDDEVVTKTSRPDSEELEHMADMAGLNLEAVNTDSLPSDRTAGDEESDSADEPQILVVEDNTDMREYIRQILTPHYQVTDAVHGTEGWEKAGEMIPDLVISDVMMPGMDGIELCDKLKNDERTSHIPVVLLTAKAGKDAKLEGLEHHADDYLTKPFDADELLVLLKNRIEQRARLRERFSREVTVQPKDIAITSADERFLQRAIEIIEENMDDFEFSVETFIEQMHLGRTQVNRKIKALTDLTPVQFIRSLRLKRAAQKISRQEDTISQIAYSVGFNNLSYFAKCFKEQLGVAPSDYTGKE